MQTIDGAISSVSQTLNRVTFYKNEEKGGKSKRGIWDRHIQISAASKIIHLLVPWFSDSLSCQGVQARNTQSGMPTF